MGGIITLTSSLRATLTSKLEQVGKVPIPRRTLLALGNFLAELCWSNYLSPSERFIRKALEALMTNRQDCSLEEIAVGLEFVAFFLSAIGPILSRNALENFTVLQPLVSALIAHFGSHSLPSCTCW